MTKSNAASSGNKVSAIGRMKALLGASSAPSSLGLLFILSMVQELGNAKTVDAVGAVDSPADLQKFVEIIRESYPEISSQLFASLGSESLPAGVQSDAVFDFQGVAAQLADLESSGYLSKAEAQLLTKTLDSLDSLEEAKWVDGAADASQDIHFAQAATGTMTSGASGAAEVAPAGEVQISTLAIGGIGALTGFSLATSTVSTTAKLPGATGTVSDGYVRGASIYVDRNGNGIADANEDSGVKTDAKGNFKLPAGFVGDIIAVGGTNIDTGLANTMVLKAAAGSTMITPLTTLVQAYIQSKAAAGTPVSATQANEAVVKALGLATGTNLATYDSLAALAANPNDANALAIQKVDAQVATIVTLASSDPLGASTDTAAAANLVISRLISSIGEAVTGKTVVDLTDTATITKVLAGATDVTVSKVVTATTHIDAATDLSSVSDAQSAVGGLSGGGSTTLVVATATESATIEYVVQDGNAGGHLTTLDLTDNATTLTDAQASALVAAGLHFATDDTGVAVQANGTHLTTSLHDLQALGVDIINVGVTTGEFAIAAGAGGIDFAHLPTVNAAAAVLVGLEVGDTTLNGISAADMLVDAKALHAAGFDAIMAADGTLTFDSAIVNAVHSGGLTFATEDQITVGVAASVQDQFVASLVGTIDGHTYAHDLDVIDLTSNAITITGAQAASLVAEGLHFAADDTGVAVQAVGTHLSTSLHDLQNLGVDFVHTDGTINTVVLDMGTGAFTNTTLPVFDAADHVQLNVIDGQLGNLEALINSANGNFANAHIDVLSVVLKDSIGAELGGLGVLDTSLHGNGLSVELNAAYATNALTLGMILDAADGAADPLALLHGNDLVTALQAAGISDIKIDHISHFTVADTDLKPLWDAGLIKAEAGADVTVTHTGSGTLEVSLAQLAGMGADHVVQTTGTGLSVNAAIVENNLAGINAELNSLLTAFEDSTGAINKPHLFTNASAASVAVDLHVTSTVANNLTMGTLDADLSAKLTLLGIDQVIDDHGHILKPSSLNAV